MESLTVGVPYILLQMVLPFADESTTILQLERIAGDFVYVTWPTCLFRPYDVARINDETMRFTITYRGQTITHSGVTHTLEFRCLSRFFPLNKSLRSLQHAVEGENVQRFERFPAHRQARQIHRGHCEQFLGIQT